jgi:hypothetical protein
MVTQKIKDQLDALEAQYLTLSFVKKPSVLGEQWDGLEKTCMKERDCLLQQADALEDLDFVYPQKEAIMAESYQLKSYMEIRKRLLIM